LRRILRDLICKENIQNQLAFDWVIFAHSRQSQQRNKSVYNKDSKTNLIKADERKNIKKMKRY
jgi:hypothetical protein